jgi:hypothetical protein
MALLQMYMIQNIDRNNLYGREVSDNALDSLFLLVFFLVFHHL